MAIRSNLARTFAGGPEFRIEPDRIIIEPEHENNVSNLAESTSQVVQETIDKTPIPGNLLNEASNRLRDLGFNVRELRNTGLIVAEAENLSAVIDNIVDMANTFSTRAVNELQSLKEKASASVESVQSQEMLGGNLNFSSDEALAQEVGIRERLANLSLRNQLTNLLTELQEIRSAELSFTRNTFGPRNLNVDIESPIRLVDDDEEEDLPNLGDAVTKIGAKNVWGSTRGENAIVAVLDTSFNGDWLNTGRLIDSFEGPDVETAFSKPEEGHGTMSAYTAAGNKEESGLPYSGVAPDAGLLLARTTSPDGALKYTEEAWDWLVGQIREADRPVFSNHSYGVPLCSAKTMNLCNSSTTKLVKAMNKREDHQAFYAAGNEALYCGHRLGGITNGINGPNSLANSIAVGALRFDLRDAQNYSSHGFGTCTSATDNPKPDVSCLIPSILPYGEKLRDMSSGVGGSSGGTSDASPMTCGVGALVGSVTGDANVEEVLQDTAMMPRITQINLLRDFDARFGHGQVQADKAVGSVLN